MTHALVLPSPADKMVKDWWQTDALPAFDAIEDPERLLEYRRQIAALAKYVKDRAQRFELNAGQIVSEVRIGELLGDGKTTQGRKLPAPVPEVAERDRVRFRLLAKHRALVLRLIAEDRIASRRRILARLLRPTNGQPTTGVEIREGDFRTVLSDLAGQVDAIVTDPPYMKEFLPLYADLSRVAADLLKPGGICVVLCAHAYLPDLCALLGRHLTYRWIMVYLLGGSAAMIHAQRVQTYWKPILVYEKPPADLSRRIGGDVVRSEGGDTDPTDHRWGQNERGIQTLLERVTGPTDLIVDPFLGGGTTLLAAHRAQRRAIGCDIDPQAIQRARERLGQ